MLKRFVEKQGGREVLSQELISRRLARLYYASGRQYFKARCMDKALIALSKSLAYRYSAKTRGLKILAQLLPFNRDDGRDLPKLVE